MVYKLIMTLKLANNLQTRLDFYQIDLAVAISSSKHISIQIKSETTDRATRYLDRFVICAQIFVP